MTPAKSLEEALQEAFHKADSLQAPLAERLKRYLSKSRELLPDLEATYDQLVQRIAGNEADKYVPSIGETLPDFSMTDSEGNLVDLVSLIAKGPLVISFNRGPWSPSMLCLEDLLDALGFVESVGGVEGTIARSDANAKVIADWVGRTPWIDFVARARPK